MFSFLMKTFVVENVPFIRNFGTVSTKRTRITTLRRKAKKQAGTKREGNYIYKQPPIKTWSIFTGDLVQVTSGKETGKQAIVSQVDRLQGKIFLQGVRTQRQMVRTASSLYAPRIGTVHLPFEYCHLKLVNPETKQPCSVRWKILENGDRVRYAKDTGALIPKPELKITRPSSYSTITDTAREDAKRVTYQGLAITK
jgi:large subunit ribosomal protein L24